MKLPSRSRRAMPSERKEETSQASHFKRINGILKQRTSL
ncbi:hypothetical protein NOC27_846 [Nitrosococcus oceani AFC27]|nr:hypothetical protein NOC27_846 [Nitrosococcus oceani AFC27]